MKFKSSFIIIPLLTIIVALVGKSITRECDAWTWYKTLQLPAATPADWVFPIAWNIIFACAAVAAIIVWNYFQRSFTFWILLMLFGANAVLNMLWSYLFFGKHLIGAALLTALVLQAVTSALAVLLYHQSKAVSLLLVPYIIWLTVAIYLNTMIWYLN